MNCLDIDLSAGVGRPGEQSIHSVFVDPGGCHCIATVVGNGGADTFYMHAKWTKPRILNKMKGLVVNAVAWNRQQITEGNFFLSAINNSIYLAQQTHSLYIYMQHLFSFNKGGDSRDRQWPVA